MYPGLPLQSPQAFVVNKRVLAEHVRLYRRLTKLVFYVRDLSEYWQEPLVAAVSNPIAVSRVFPVCKVCVLVGKISLHKLNGHKASFTH